MQSADRRRACASGTSIGHWRSVHRLVCLGLHHFWRRGKPGRPTLFLRSNLTRRNTELVAGGERFRDRSFHKRVQRKKRPPKVCETVGGRKKIPGAVLLSHSQMYSTIAAGVLNHRVREGNGCFNSAMSTGKNYNEEECLSEKNCDSETWRKRISVGNSLDFFLKSAASRVKKKGG